MAKLLKKKSAPMEKLLELNKNRMILTEEMNAYLKSRSKKEHSNLLRSKLSKHNSHRSIDTRLLYDSVLIRHISIDKQTHSLISV